MPYNSEQFLDLFEKSFFETQTLEEKIEALRHGDVFKYRAKTYRVGKVLECEIFPIWNTQGEASRAKKAQESRTAQKNLNHKNTKKSISRLANYNFCAEGDYKKRDIWVTFGYDDENLPPTPRAARRDMVNYLRRINRKRKKEGLPPLRYIYVTEFVDENGDPVRVHHHVIMSGDMDRDYIETEWKHGDRPQARRLVSDDCGLTGLAHYLSKCTSGQKFWAHSTNLKMPVPTVADKKITKRQLEKLAINRAAAPAFFEKVFAGYTFKDTERDIQIKQSDFVAGAYIYIQMHRKPPPRNQCRRAKE